MAFKGGYLSYKKIARMFVKPAIAAVGMFAVIAWLEKCFAYNMITFLFITAVGAGVYGIVLLIIKDEFAQFALSRYIKPMVNKFVLRHKG